MPSSSWPALRYLFKKRNFLVRDLKHPSLDAKKYDETADRWLARVNDDWRFYFNIVGDRARLLNGFLWCDFEVWRDQ